MLMTMLMGKPIFLKLCQRAQTLPKIVSLLTKQVGVGGFLGKPHKILRKGKYLKLFVLYAMRRPTSKPFSYLYYI